MLCESCGGKGRELDSKRQMCAGCLSRELDVMEAQYERTEERLEAQVLLLLAQLGRVRYRQRGERAQGPRRFAVGS